MNITNAHVIGRERPRNNSTRSDNAVLCWVLLDVKLLCLGYRSSACVLRRVSALLVFCCSFGARNAAQCGSRCIKMPPTVKKLKGETDTLSGGYTLTDCSTDCTTDCTTDCSTDHDARTHPWRPAAAVWGAGSQHPLRPSSPRRLRPLQKQSTGPNPDDEGSASLDWHCGVNLREKAQGCENIGQTQCAARTQTYASCVAGNPCSRRHRTTEADLVPVGRWHSSLKSCVSRSAAADGSRSECWRHVEQQWMGRNKQYRLALTRKAWRKSRLIWVKVPEHRTRSQSANWQNTWAHAAPTPVSRMAWKLTVVRYRQEVASSDRCRLGTDVCCWFRKSPSRRDQLLFAEQRSTDKLRRFTRWKKPGERTSWVNYENVVLCVRW
jgi:hypothetical protein